MPEPRPPREPGAEHRLEARLLGDLALRYDGRPLPEAAFRRRKSLLLLLRLLVEPGRRLPVDTILEMLWPEEDPRAGAVHLRAVRPIPSCGWMPRWPCTRPCGWRWTWTASRRPAPRGWPAIPRRSGAPWRSTAGRCCPPWPTRDGRWSGARRWPGSTGGRRWHWRRRARTPAATGTRPASRCATRTSTCAGTAKQLTLLHPASGAVRVKGVRSTANAVLHPWLQAELAGILAALPEPEPLPPDLPPLRMLQVLDNLIGHHTAAFVRWLVAHGVMPLYTPLGGSWLNMAESAQRILKRRALDGAQPETPEQIIAWLEAAGRGWNREPTPFLWGGKRRARRERARERRHRLGGSGAYTQQPVPRRQAA